MDWRTLLVTVCLAALLRYAVNIMTMSRTIIAIATATTILLLTSMMLTIGVGYVIPRASFDSLWREPFYVFTFGVTFMGLVGIAIEPRARLLNADMLIVCLMVPAVELFESARFTFFPLDGRTLLSTTMLCTAIAMLIRERRGVEMYIPTLKQQE